jgi:hypothetical protein
MNRGQAIGAGLLAGAVAGLVRTVVMLLLASLFGAATPFAIFGDRLSVFSGCRLRKRPWSRCSVSSQHLLLSSACSSWLSTF